MLKRILLLMIFALTCSLAYGQGGNGPTGPIPSQTYTQLPAGSGIGTAHQVTLPLQCADTSSSATTYTCTTSPSLGALTTGDTFIFTSINQNNSGSSTLNIDGIGAKTIKKYQNSANLAAGDLQASASVKVTYDGTNLELDTIGQAPSGTGTVNSCATTGALAEYTGSGTTVGCGNADVTYTTHTLAVGASGLFDLSAMTSTNFKFPSSLASTLFVGLNSSEEPVAATAANAATLIQGLTGCNTATYVFTPQASDCVPGGVVPNAQTGTTYTYLASDRLGYTTFSNASSIAAGLPQAGTTGFASNWVNKSCNIGAGTVTITPTTSTISYTNWLTYTSGASSVALTTGQCIFIYSDNANYFANLEQLANLGTPTTLTLTNATGLPVSTGISGLGTNAAGSLAVSSTTFTNATTAVGGNACSASAATVTMTGATSSMVPLIGPSADISGGTGWGSTGGLVIDAWFTSNTLNYKLCNQTAGSITPTAETWNASAR